MANYSIPLYTYIMYILGKERSMQFLRVITAGCNPGVSNGPTAPYLCIHTCTSWARRGPCSSWGSLQLGVIPGLGLEMANCFIPLYTYSLGKERSMQCHYSRHIPVITASCNVEVLLLLLLITADEFQSLQPAVM